MKLFIFLLVVFSLVVPLQSFAVEAQQVVTIRLISRVEVNKSKDIQGLFEGLTAEASKIGLAEATVHGKMAYKRLPNKSVRVKIQWHSLGMAKGGATEPLKSPLLSQFTVKDKKIEPGTQVQAKGNLEGVTNTFLALKDRAKSETPRHLVDSKETNKSSETTKLADGGLSPTGTSGGSGGSAAPTGSDSDSTSVTTDLITTSWEVCQPRIDSDNGLLHLQWRRTEKNSDGTVVDQGACLDTGESVAGVRTYGSCAGFIDYAVDKVFQKFTLAGTVDGVSYSIADCVIDPDRFFNIQATQNGCGMRHDFNVGQSVQQERLFYVDSDGATIDVSQCQDTSIAYAHFITEQTCNPTIDTISNVVFINKRTAYRLNDGTMQFANDCRPVDQAGVPVLEEYCSPKYEHDFINNVSYYSTRNYYLDEAGATKYITACSRSATASFSHIFQTSGCGTTHDDILLQSTQQSKTEIHTVDDGVIELVACQDQGMPTSYAYLREDSTVQPDFVTVLQAGKTTDSNGQYSSGANTDYTIQELVRPGLMWTHVNTSFGVGGNNPPYTIEVGQDGFTETIYPDNHAAFFVYDNGRYRAPGTINTITEPWRVSHNNYVRNPGLVYIDGAESIVRETTFYKVYRRGDSTEFWKEDGSQVAFRVQGIPK